MDGEGVHGAALVTCASSIFWGSGSSHAALLALSRPAVDKQGKQGRRRTNGMRSSRVRCVAVRGTGSMESCEGREG